MTDDRQTPPPGQPAQTPELTPEPPSGPQSPTQQPPPSAGRRFAMSRPFVVALLGGLVCIVLIVGAVAIFSSHGKSKPVAPVAAKPWRLSADQRRVVQEFGPPQTFSVVYGSDPKHDEPDKKGGFPVHRFEAWAYNKLGVQFFFRDGSTAGDGRTPVASAAATYPKLRPEEFSRGMSVQDVVKIIGAAPTKTSKVAPNVFKALQAFEFGGQVVAEFDQGRLVVVQTAPVVPEGGQK